jgi:alpha-L-fucosidase 2
MKTIRFINYLTIPFICLTFYSCTPKELKVNQAPMNWRYDVPATKYWESLPIGTGRFGAMIPGAIEDEVIAFNDETLWTGGPYNPNNPEGAKAIQNIRKFAFEHNWKAANDEAWKLSSIPQSVQYYQPMGRLNIHYEGHKPDKLNDYSRSLSMDSAMANVDYQLDGVRYSRRIFASYPDQVIVIRLTANQKGKINFSSWFTSLQPSAQMHIENDNLLVMEGTTISEKPKETILPPQMKWQSKLKIIPEGGTLKTDDNKLTVTNADAVTLILAGATNWVNWNDVSADEKKRCDDYITDASQFSYKELLKRHLDDYCPRFASCQIDLGPEPDPSLTTTQSMQAIRGGAFDPAYEARYFQYGRYLMLAGARENTLAFNNHNMWLNDLDGRWRGRWTLNINIQECYWPVESTNMPEINESLLLFVENLAQAGERTANELYNCRGWCAHHGTDIWFNTAPTDGDPRHATYPVAGLWLMQQLYEHYRYNPDLRYLMRIYPLMKGAAQFCLDFMTKDPDSEYAVTCPSSSPENSFIDEKGNVVSISFGSAGDIQLVRNLLRNCLEAFSILSVDAEMCNRLASLLYKLPPHKIGKHGQLQEWYYDFEESEVTHRHLSHLFAAYPDDDITFRKDPKLAEAVKVVLKRRGDINMGWSGAWKINQHARLEEPAEAYGILHKMLTDISIHPAAEDSQVTPSFEGNQAIQGVTAGMVEMLLQSHSKEISFLPALPEQWKTGAVKGLRARGGYEVDMRWENGALSEAVIKANYHQHCLIRTQTPVEISSDDDKRLTITSPEENVIKLDVRAGKTYRLKGK